MAAAFGTWVVLAGLGCGVVGAVTSADGPSYIDGGTLLIVAVMATFILAVASASILWCARAVYRQLVGPLVPRRPLWGFLVGLAYLFVSVGFVLLVGWLQQNADLVAISKRVEQAAYLAPFVVLPAVAACLLWRRERL